MDSERPWSPVDPNPQPGPLPPGAAWWCPGCGVEQPPDDADLDVERLARTDPAAWHRLARRHHPDCFRFRLRPGDEAPY